MGNKHDLFHPNKAWGCFLSAHGKTKLDPILKSKLYLVSTHQLLFLLLG